MTLRNTILALFALIALGPAQAFAAAFLMTSDGVSGINNSRAVTLGHAVTTASSGSIIAMSQSSLSAFDVIWFSPANNYTNIRTGVAPGGALDQYVQSGGTLVLHVAGNSGNQNDIAPGGVDYDRSRPTNSETFVDPLHPYVTGSFPGGVALSESDFDNWSSTDHGFLFNLLPNTDVILTNIDGPTLVSYTHGLGNVILSTLTYGWGSNGARGAPLDNLINGVASFSSSPAPVPTPGALALLGLGLLGLGVRRRAA